MSVLAVSQVSLYPGATPSATVTRVAEWFSGGKGERDIITRSLKFTAVSVGGATNTIGAAACGFKTFLACSSFFDSTNSKIIPAAIDPVNNVILLGAGSSLAVGDLSTVTGYITITGSVKAPPATT